jgi:hypothetical protein
MKRKKLLKKLSDYFDMDARKLCQKRDKMKELLRQLRKKEKQLQIKHDTEEDEQKKKRLQKHLAIVHAQRVKGISALKEMGCDGS